VRTVIAVAALWILAGCDGATNPSNVASLPPRASGTLAPSDLGRGTEWTERTEALIPLTEVAVAAHDGKIWVAGGLTADGKASTAVQIYDPATNSWSEGPALPAGAHHAALVSAEDALWFLGGYKSDGFNEPSNEALSLLPDGDEWLPDEPLPQPRAAGAAAWDGARIVYAGGVGPDGLKGDVFVRGAEGWTTGGQLTLPREHLAATSDGAGNVFVMGGRRGGLDTNLARVDLVAGGQVEELVDLATPRGGVAAFWSPTTGACLVGGESPSGTNEEVECVSADGAIISQPPLTKSRHGLGAAVVEGVAYVLLGGPQPGLTVSGTVEALELPPG
jgi:non-specific serine/threonine protein kinase